MPRRATGSIRKKRGKYQIRWTDHLRRQRTKVVGTRRAAELELKRILLRVEEERQGLKAPTCQEVPTFEVLIDEWLNRRAVRKRSRKSDESYIRVHLRPAFGGLRISEIGAREIEKFKAERTHLTENSVNHFLSLLISMLRHAVDLGWLERLPKVKKHKSTTNSQDFKYLQTRSY